MAELQTAQRHLSEALQRLETALGNRLSRAPGTNSEHHLDAISAERDALARDVASLRDECNRLSVALHEVEEQNRAMREVTEAVVRRLDGPISELDRLLEG